MVETKNVVGQENVQSDVEKKIRKRLFFLQYRGKSSEHFARSLHRCNAPCTLVMTLRKVKTVMPSLKLTIPKMLRS